MGLERPIELSTMSNGSTDLFFRPLFAFFMIELKSRKVIHVGVTRSPTDAWVAQQLREATRLGASTEISHS
jgi:hypothetical protein